MTDTEVTEPAVTLESLDHYVTEDGLFVFLGNVQDICKKVESLGFSIYYVLAEEKFYPEVNGKPAATASTKMQAFKVVSNFIGRVCVPTDELAFDSIEKSVWFGLPKIPYAIKEKLDLFFRAVDQKLHTESIVLLTFDSTKYGDPDGWGILVPEQENTAADCKYEPDSIVDQKPDHVYLVGSVHSHPDMPAYASGKDHKDQDANDGLHITYGWQKTVNNGETQYHVEFQFMGTSIVAPPESVFEPRPKYDVDDTDVEQWMTKVTKKTGNVAIAGKGGPNSGNDFRNTGWQSGGGNMQTIVPTELYKVKNYPADGPKLTENVIIGMIGLGENACPFCEVQLVNIDTEKRRCMSCHQYIAYTGESIEDIVKIRKDALIYTHDLDAKASVISKDVYTWYRVADGNHYELVLGKTTKGADQGK